MMRKEEEVEKSVVPQLSTGTRHRDGQMLKTGWFRGMGQTGQGCPFNETSVQLIRADLFCWWDDRLAKSSKDSARSTHKLGNSQRNRGLS